MKTVTELAREAWPTDNDGIAYLIPEGFIQRFHDLAIAQYRESLLAGVGEPYCKAAVLDEWFAAKAGIDPEAPLYTADQLAAAVLREREACARKCEEYDGAWYAYRKGAQECAAAIRGQK